MSKIRILLNAEAFGFGPSAAIGAVFCALKDAEGVSALDYAGCGHSLDLQRSLNYGAFFELDENDEEGFKQIVRDYDFFITAMDFKKAQWAHEAGVRPIVYDLLAWHWKTIPEAATLGGYIAQDFFGVRDRLFDEGINHARIISPVLQPPPAIKEPKNLTLVNFGGLANPLWDFSVSLEYARKNLAALMEILPQDNLVLACSAKHAQALGNEYPAQVFSWKEMQGLLARANLVIATPGLGNIFECANYGPSCVFMPPANGSQGKQAELLSQGGYSDSLISWNELGEIIDWRREQSFILNQIKEAIENVSPKRLAQIWEEKIMAAGNRNLTGLIEFFGNEGEEQLKEALLAELELL